MIKTIHTLSIKDFSLYVETKDERYLMSVKLPRFLFKYYSKKLNKLKEELIKRFNEGEYQRLAEKEMLIYYYYFSYMQYDSMYRSIRALASINKVTDKVKDWFKTVTGKDFKITELKGLKDKAIFFHDKYKEANIKSESNENYTINDMIAGLEGILGINIDRSQPVSTLSSYIKVAEKRLSTSKAKQNG